jgi:hypothetical protein
VGEGAEKRSRGRPPGAVAAGGADEDEALLQLSEGRDRPPSPDIDSWPSSSANASNEMRSAAFLLGLCLDISTRSERQWRDSRLDKSLSLGPISHPTSLISLQSIIDQIVTQQQPV